jgi:hypothetical protein
MIIAQRHLRFLSLGKKSDEQPIVWSYAPPSVRVFPVNVNVPGSQPLRCMKDSKLEVEFEQGISGKNERYKPQRYVDVLKVDLFPQEKYTQFFRLNEVLPFTPNNNGYNRYICNKRNKFCFSTSINAKRALLRNIN